MSVTFRYLGQEQVAQLGGLDTGLARQDVDWEEPAGMDSRSGGMEGGA